MDVDKFDAIVIGVGGHGSSALYHLAKRGQKVLGIEQFQIAHDRGSSHGESRIIRLAYHEDPAYVPLLTRAYELWQTLQEEYGKELLCVTGSVEAASRNISPQEKSVFRDALKAAQMHGLQHEVLSPAEANTRFPGYHLPADYDVLYQPQGGLLLSERCIEAHVAVARQHGAQVHTGEAVLSWHEVPAQHGGEPDIIVVTSKAHYRTKRVVLTAGAWIPQLVPAMQACAVAQRNVIGWFGILKPSHFNRRRFPVYILQDGEAHFYGFPQYEHPGMKIGKFYHLNQTVHNPSQLDRNITAEDEEALRIAVRDFFPTANGPLLRAAACMFTNTEDTRFVIDFHPTHSQVILCSACSGHGFKFCSVLGEILADLVTTSTTEHKIDTHRICADRPGHREFLELAKMQKEAQIKNYHAPVSHL